MDTLGFLMHGFGVALQPLNLGYCFLGVVMGTLVGVLPGISSLGAVAMLLPITLGLPPATALIMLAGVYYGSEYGGSITSILLNIPGNPAAAVTCQEGYPMAKAGRGGQALILSAIASFAGGIVGVLFMLWMAPALAELSFALGPADYFAAMLFALLATALFQHGSPIKGLTMVLLGVSLAMIGTDSQTGLPRLTFGWLELRDGISIAVLAMGLFGVSEVMQSLLQRDASFSGSSRFQWIPSFDEWRRSTGSTLRGSVVGSLLGALPGTGTTASTVVALGIERMISRTPERFGQGMVEGVAAPEAANNAASQTAFVPTMMLGIPGSATMALILAAMTMHGVTPSPLLPQEQPDFFWGLIASFLVGNVLLLVLNVPLVKVWIAVLRIPARALFPFVLALIVMAVYASSGSMFDVVLVLVLGVMGYLLRAQGFHLTPLLIGFVLGPLIEDNLRRALTISQGDLGILVSSPVSIAIHALIVLLCAVVCWSRWRRFRSERFTFKPKSSKGS